MTKSKSTRVNLSLSADAWAALNRLAPSENKRGAYVSALILQADDQPRAALDPQEAAYAAIGRQVLALARELARSLPETLGETEDGGA